MGRRRVLVETAVQSHWASQGVGCLGALALIPLVALVVAFFMGIGNGPRGIEEVLPWLGVATVVFGSATAWVWFRSKKELRLTVGDDDVLHLTIDGHRTVGPLRCEYGYLVERIKGIPMCHLTLHVYDAEGKHVCSLGESWGAIHGKPGGWPHDIIPPRGAPGPAWVAAKGRFVLDVQREIEARDRADE